MKKTLKLLFIFTILATYSNAQTVDIKVEVLQSFASKAKLYVYRNGEAMLTDSSWQTSPGTYKFSLDSTHQKGLYKVEVGKSISFDIIVYNEPSIDIKTVVFAPNDSLKSHNSIENTVYWKYLNLKKKNDQQVWLINSLLSYYSDTSAVNRTLKNEIARLNSTLYKYTEKSIKKHSNLFANQLIALEQKPVPPVELSADKRFSFQIDTWWNNVDLTNPQITHAPTFSKSIWEYVETLFSEDLDKEQQDSAFISGIDKFLSVKMDTTVLKTVREMLVEGFLESDYSDVVCYLETTSFHGVKPLKTSRIEVLCQNKSLEIGSKASDFTLLDQNRKKVKLSKLNADYILVVFWSTWCPHCIESLPQIVDLYNKYKNSGFEVVAISIDDEDELWKQYLEKFNASWINMREPYSPDSKLIELYDVQETPKMYLLSKDLTIISKPSTRRQLEVKIRRLMRHK